MRFSGVLLLVALLGCGPGKTSETPDNTTTATPDAAVGPAAPADLIALVEAELTVLEKIAAAAKDAPDCNGIAANLTTIAEGPDGAAMGKSAQHPAYAAWETEIQNRYLGRIDAAVGTLLQAVTPCRDHAAVDEVMTKLGFGG
jgi:hypothetical protein